MGGKEKASAQTSTVTRKHEWLKKLGGFICLFVVIADWVLMSVIAGGFDKPLFTRFIVQSSYMVVLIPYGIYRFISYSARSSSSDSNSNNSNDAEKVSLATDHKSISSKEKTSSQSDATHQETNLVGIVKWSFLFTLLSLFCGYTWYLSLATTNFAVNNTIYQSQCVIVYILSAIFLGTPITWKKSIPVVLCSGGVALISFSSSQSPNSGNTPFGLVMCVGSTFMYANIALICGHVNTRFFNPKNTVGDSMLFQGVSGLVSFFSLWVILLIWHFAGLEIFEWPSPKLWGSILTLASLNCLFFFSFLVGTVCTSPVFMATGSLLLVPVSFIVDVISSQQTPNVGSILGALIICLSFLLMELPVFQYVRSYFASKKTKGKDIEFADV